MMLMLIKTTGDVTFYQNEAGEIFQQILDQTPHPLAIEDETYCDIQSDDLYVIRYDLSGSTGFSVWSKDEMFYEDEFWTIKAAEDYILRELPRSCACCQKTVYFEKSPEWEICECCETIVCADCVDWTNSLQNGQSGVICKSCATSSTNLPEAI